MKTNKGFRFSVVVVFLLLNFTLFTYNVSAEPLNMNVGSTYDAMQNISDFEELLTVTYTDSSVVTVNSDGSITAVQPGSTDIVIVYLSFEGVISELEYEITVELATGYYRIKNRETERYLSIGNIKSKLDPTVYLDSYSDEGKSELRQIWYVINSTDRYIIKPYLDENAILFY